MYHISNITYQWCHAMSICLTGGVPQMEEGIRCKQWVATHSCPWCIFIVCSHMHVHSSTRAQSTVAPCYLEVPWDMKGSLEFQNNWISTKWQSNERDPQSVAKLMTHSAKFWNLLDECHTTAKENTGCQISPPPPPPQSLLITLSGTMVTSCLVNIVQGGGGGGCFT